MIPITLLFAVFLFGVLLGMLFPQTKDTYWKVTAYVALVFLALGIMG